MSDIKTQIFEKTSTSGTGTAITSTFASAISTAAGTMSATIGGSAGTYCFTTNCNAGRYVSSSTSNMFNLAAIVSGLSFALLF